MMKTNQNLTRKMGDFDVIQRTSDGYFDANLLLGAWNKTKGNSQRKMTEFTERPNTNEFIDELKCELISMGEVSPMAEFQPIIKIKGRMTKKGKTKDQVWMHPYLFIKFAMWINPRFEVKVIKFVYDQLIQYRNDAGDSYKTMASAICTIVPKGNQAKAIAEISKANNYIIFGNHAKEIRNKEAEEKTMRSLDELQKDITKLIDDGFISNYESLMAYLRNKWKKAYQPAFITA